MAPRAAPPNSLLTALALGELSNPDTRAARGRRRVEARVEAGRCPRCEKKRWDCRCGRRSQ